MQRISTKEAEILASEIALLKSGRDIIAEAKKFKVYRELMLMLYHDCILKGMPRLEDLPLSEKQAIWNETKKETGGLDKKGCIELSKIIYMISQKI